MSDDDIFLAFLLKIVSTNKVYFYDGTNKIILDENCGAMAGVPISSFLANIYLSDLDKYFEINGINYLRYSDDIIVFADSLFQIEQYKQVIFNIIEQKGLIINPQKSKIVVSLSSMGIFGF